MFLRPGGWQISAFGLTLDDMWIVKTPPERHDVAAPRITKEWGVEEALPEYERLGYSREEANRIVRICEALWSRYTALGLTLDSPIPSPTALHPFEVLVQAIWQAGIIDLLDDSPVVRR